MRRILGAAFVFLALTVSGLSSIAPVQARPRAQVSSTDRIDLRPTDISARRYHPHRNHHVYGPYYQPHWRWGRPYYYRPYYARSYYQPYGGPYYGSYGLGFGYYGGGARYYTWAPRYYGWGPRYAGCCGWGWGGPRFYGPGFGVGFGF
ncbi:MAG: hypothetical protein K2W78_04055 [Xanthobacteraceae bacterium]|nr:hypothetical protein [Xanthobacteraceae bacterium]